MSKITTRLEKLERTLKPEGGSLVVYADENQEGIFWEAKPEGRGRQFTQAELDAMHLDSLLIIGLVKEPSAHAVRVGIDWDRL